jgi:D-3-phosphoglycerate dehydrogenase
MALAFSPLMPLARSMLNLPKFSFKAVRADREGECEGIDKSLCEAGGTVVKLQQGAGEDALAEAAADADLLLVSHAPVTARVIASGKKLKGIVKYGVGIDNIDVEAAKLRRIPVVNVPDYAEETVAEGAFALMIALMKKVTVIDRAVHESGWIVPEPKWRGLDLAGRTLGLVGAGRIGRSMARMAQGFRMRVTGYSPRADAETMAEAGIEKRDDLRAMLSECDVVSIHAVLRPETRHMIGFAELSAMRPTAYLINTARGAIVDETALLHALRERWIAGAALDVYGREPLNRDDHPLRPLYGMDNVILFPHLTFYTAEAIARLEEETLARCFEILAGKPVRVKSHDPRLRAQDCGVVFE